MHVFLTLVSMVLAFTSPLAAAEKSRTLEELVQTVLEKGETTKVDAQTARMLGLGQEAVPAKAMWYEAAATSDGRDHVFNVIMRQEESDTANEIVWEIQRTTTSAAGKFINGAAFRLSLKGRLISGLKISGKIGRLTRSPLKPTSSDTKAVFQKELKFWQKESIDLELKNQ